MGSYDHTPENDGVATEEGSEKEVAPVGKSRSVWRKLVLWGILACGLLGGIVILVFLDRLPELDQVALDLKARGQSSESFRYVELDQISPDLIRALVAIEDRRFYEHSGVDLRGILRALIGNAASGEIEQGASTLTMQLARRLFLSDERTYTRKLKEVIVAYRMDQEWEKDQILEFYLNEVYFGSGAYGIEEASQTYFQVSARELELWQAALLAGLVQAPTAYSPFSNPGAAVRRQRQVLLAMHREGLISKEDLAEAKEQAEIYWLPDP